MTNLENEITYKDKTYGRNHEVAELFKMFEAGRDVSMHGPRRLGKTFLLDRLVDAAPTRGWTAVKVELAGCTDSRAVFRELCKAIGSKRAGGQSAIDWFRQRSGQWLSPRADTGGPWYQSFISLDHETYFERLIKAMHDDPKRKWLLLIDELPIYLKALHDKGPDGVTAARDFMNLTSRLREHNPRVRWLITGSIGIQPLAQIGNYLGVLAKLQSYDLQTLSEAQAVDFVRDLAASGRLLHRQEITDAEAQALVSAVGWSAAYYLDALAQHLTGPLSIEVESAKQSVETAVVGLLNTGGMAAFGVWDEHLRKHYGDTERAVACSALSAMAQEEEGANIDQLLHIIARPELSRDALLQVLKRLHDEGFVIVDDWDQDSPQCRIRVPLLRRWWLRYPPQANP